MKYVIQINHLSDSLDITKILTYVNIFVANGTSSINYNYIHLRWYDNVMRKPTDHMTRSENGKTYKETWYAETRVDEKFNIKNAKLPPETIQSRRY